MPAMQTSSVQKRLQKIQLDAQLGCSLLCCCVNKPEVCIFLSFAVRAEVNYNKHFRTFCFSGLQVGCDKGDQQAL